MSLAEIADRENLQSLELFLAMQAIFPACSLSAHYRCRLRDRFVKAWFLRRDRYCVRIYFSLFLLVESDALILQLKIEHSYLLFNN